MKKMLSALSVLSVCLLSAQLYIPGTPSVSTNTNVGINTASPQGSLDINANGNIPVIRGNGGYIPTGLRFIDDSYTQQGNVKEWAIWKGNQWAKGLAFMRYDAVDYCATGICDAPLFLHDNGNIGMGSLNPDAKLTVKGKIHAEEIKVDLNVPADYVFQKYYTGASSLKPEYTIPTLEDVEKFTKENNHLPNIPSAKEIQEKGLNVGEMSNLLLQKIEELTLYTIEQNKLIKEQQKRIEALEQAKK
ncbi:MULTISPECIES: hypothetical protein [Chryseobacterium]|jgi:hypothetical protein|uniref:Cell wall anchor protein n=1 Tax=Chryseobacterium rhizosphaerae TaxID=395937 RepID=A0ABX9IQ56_9FLAO|nr:MULTISPECIES: hypothetical protein [Chryseobacterium]MBL3546813.1 hypothetical protein [Chryseobacterium sp. KMC2]MDC8102157.1 hypothetical protein [Chryseobacterium rhizosphaerae]REC78242.1 hypothetical protein DRF57_02070 [Chryseobacterium rhizosphaerae]GEN66526.1 hypothetical protein CRH01_10940 [Chryseobacterium rhizosphaerae]